VSSTTYTIDVEVGNQLLDDIADCPAVEALEELIWNALDADANRVHVKFTEVNAMGGLETVIVEDDGHGIPFDEIQATFKVLGDSPKRKSRYSPDGRRYHGQNGKGRFKAFAIGAQIRWEIHYEDSSGKLLQYSIQAKDARPVFEISDPVTSDRKWPGVDVVIENVRKEAFRLDTLRSFENIQSRLAPYLIAQNEIKVQIGGRVLDPDDTVERIYEVPLARTIYGAPNAPQFEAA
jgi:hypothetical protein